MQIGKNNDIIEYENDFQIGDDFMHKNNSYNTKQKEIIEHYIKNKVGDFTVKEIYNDLNKEIGLTTIYRMIQKLTDDGVISKSIGADNTTYYCYLETCNKKNHFYLKCEFCGNMIHVDCDCITELSLHILKNHKFKTSENNIIINGICNKCFKAKEEV